MPPPPESRPQHDRQAHLRSNAPAIASLRQSADARSLILVAGKPVILSAPDRSHTAIRWFDAAEIARVKIDPRDALFLGTADGHGRFALLLSEDQVASHAGLLSPAVDFRSLITQGTMGEADLATLALAISLCHWDRHSRFCGACGAATHNFDAGWKRKCPACEVVSFPRVDPVVIMLVNDGDQVVLAREPHFPPGMYSALAGFVEPGESIEQAVARETLEEIGVEVHAITYAENQPLPMPHSLMLGCFALIRGPGELRVDTTEIEDARWFSATEVSAMLAGTHSKRLWLPPPATIAHRLIRRWLDGPRTGLLE